MLFHYVIIHLYELLIHPEQGLMYRPYYHPHYLVYQLRVLIEHAFEDITMQHQHMRILTRSQRDRMAIAIDKPHGTSNTSPGPTLQA